MNNTVAIITCRRPQGLERLLRKLVQQELKGGCFDILVVDNACQSEVANLVSRLGNVSPVAIRYEEEPEPGIVAARNKCVACFLEGLQQNLVFIDDDEWPESTHWLQKLLTAQSDYNADIVTSHVISVGEAGTPGWAVDLIYGANTLEEGQLVRAFYTNNLLISRHVLQKIQPAFSRHFAMTGASDYHFSLKCSRAGFNAYYTEAPVIEEFPASRATLRWFLRRGFRSGVGYTRSHVLEEPGIIAVSKCLAMSLVRVGRGVLSVLSGLLTLNRTRFTEGLFRFASATGTVSGLFGAQLKEYKVIHGK
jgi:glycosyltransferase involved in cell wall biosynthesis